MYTFKYDMIYYDFFFRVFIFKVYLERIKIEMDKEVLVKKMVFLIFGFLGRYIYFVMIYIRIYYFFVL